MFSGRDVRTILKDVCVDIDEQVVIKMIRRFALMVNISVNTNDSSIMLEAYNNTLALPFTKTSSEMEGEGYVLDGNLINGSERTLIVFDCIFPCISVFKFFHGEDL
jgi:hypothetical protein